MPSATLEILDDRWVLRCSPLARDLAAQIPALRFDRELEAWAGPLVLSTPLVARSLFGPGLQPTNDAFEVVDQWNREAESARRDLSGSNDPEAVRTLYRLSPALFPEQVGSSALMSQWGWFLNCDDRGSGKSVQTVCALNAGGHWPALIIAPKSMLYTWADEVRKHTNAEPFVLVGTAPQRKKIIEEARTHPRPVIISTLGTLKAHSRHAGYGSVRRKDEHREPKELNGGWIKTVVVDEAQALKDPKAQQTRAAWAVGDEAEHRIALTGTPIVNTPLDLWGILRFLSPQDFPSRSKFQDRYVLTREGFWGGTEDLGLNPVHQPELDRILTGHYCRRPLRLPVEVLPPQVRWLDMESKQAKAYRDMEKDMMAEVDGNLLLTTNPMTLAMRLGQIASATPVVDEAGNVTSLDSPSCKISALLELLDEMAGDPLVVFAESRKLIELAHRTLTGGAKPLLRPDQVGLITGQVSSVERAAHIDAFQRGEQVVILCTLGAGAEGITLTRSNTICFLQRSFSYVKNIQAEGRVARIGQERDVRYIEFITRGTVESRVYQAIAAKEDKAQDFLRDPEFVRRVLFEEAG